jgi:hypothetical protein
MFLCNCIKKGESRGYKNVTLETIMKTKADKAVRKSLIMCRLSCTDLGRGKQVYLQQIKKKAKTEGKTCHAKTMLSLEQPIKLL